ncbi:MAG: molybdenum cofactor biosynthesis protein MoaE [Candidatus Bathyarchaeales archaeon]
MSNMYVHVKESFSLDSLIEKVKNKDDFKKAGAIVMFIGVVRGETSSGEKVQKLEIEAYEEKANDVLSNICQDLKKREGIVDVQIHHLLGEFSVGEDLVYVLVAGSHRENVFPVLREAVERYKKEVPIFKKEFRINSKGVVKASWVAEERDGH